MRLSSRINPIHLKVIDLIFNYILKNFIFFLKLSYSKLNINLFRFYKDINERKKDISVIPRELI